MSLRRRRLREGEESLPPRPTYKKPFCRECAFSAILFVCFGIVFLSRIFPEFMRQFDLFR